MATETVDQIKKLHTIEDVEQAIFALERGMPVHPRIIDTMKMLCQVLIIDYNNSYAPGGEGDTKSPPVPPGEDE